MLLNWLQKMFSIKSKRIHYLQSNLCLLSLGCDIVRTSVKGAMVKTTRMCWDLKYLKQLISYNLVLKWEKMCLHVSLAARLPDKKRTGHIRPTWHQHHLQSKSLRRQALPSDIHIYVHMCFAWNVKWHEKAYGDWS